jgi:O-antigen/teichoic acid export membrane protein
MRELLQRLAKLTSGYGLVTWAGPLLSLVFTPIITRVVGPSDYGTADYINTIGSALAMVTLLGLPQALYAHFHDHPEDKRWSSRTTGTVLAITLGISVPVGIIMVVLAPQVAAQAFGAQEYVGLLRLTGVALAFGVLTTVLTTAAQVGLRVRWGMLFSVTTLTITILGNILLIVVLRLGVAGMVLTPILATTGVSIAALIVMRRTIGRPSAAIARILLPSAIVLYPTVLAGWMLQVVDRFFLVQYVSTTELGYYAIANRIAGLVSIAISPVLAAWPALALATQYEFAARDRMAMMARYLVMIILGASLGLGLFAPEILIILTRPAYLPAAPYVGFLTYMHTFNAFVAILSVGALVDKKLKEMSWAVIAGALLNLVLNQLLIPRFGLWGATTATVLGYAVPPVVLYVLLRRRNGIPYPTARILAALAVQFGLLILGLMVPAMWFPYRLVLKSFLFWLLPLSFVALRLVTPFELHQAWSVVRHRLRQLHLGVL